MKDSDNAVTKSLSVRIYPMDQETDATWFILYYAFYKDLASTTRSEIPVYHTVHAQFAPLKKDSFLLFAQYESLEIGSLWITIIDKTATLRGIGSLQEGMKRGVIDFLLREGIKLAKKEDADLVVLGQDMLLPFAKASRQQIHDKFSDMIRA